MKTVKAKPRKVKIPWWSREVKNGVKTRTNFITKEMQM